MVRIARLHKGLCKGVDTIGHWAFSENRVDEVRGRRGGEDTV
jgi:hypothetical protein